MLALLLSDVIIAVLPVLPCRPWLAVVLLVGSRRCRRRLLQLGLLHGAYGSCPPLLSSPCPLDPPTPPFLCAYFVVLRVLAQTKQAFNYLSLTFSL